MENNIIGEKKFYVEKAVAEFNVWDNNVPCAKYKVKVYEKPNGKYVAYTNLQIKDSEGVPYCGVGHGNDIDSALQDVILFFTNMYKERILKDEDFCYMDPMDF